MNEVDGRGGGVISCRWREKQVPSQFKNPLSAPSYDQLVGLNYQLPGSDGDAGCHVDWTPPALPHPPEGKVVEEF